MLDGHAEDSTLTAVVFKRRGHLLASGGTDGRVCVWQPQNKKQPLVGATGEGDEVTALLWSPDEKLLGVGYGSGTVSVMAVS